MNGGKLACAFPGPAIGPYTLQQHRLILTTLTLHGLTVDIPHSMAKDSDFVSELALFLSQMSSEAMPDAQPTARKAKKQVQEARDTMNPRYITQLFTGILCGIGHAADVQRIQKRIADEMHWRSAFLPWRRSPCFELPCKQHCLARARFTRSTNRL
jgi:hypothetical protein